MRIVMLTDDASEIDRRILLEAEALSEEGHEVIVVARRDGEAPDADRVGLVKILRIDTDLSFFQGAYVGLGAETAPPADGPGQTQESAVLREELAQAGALRLSAELDWDERWRAFRKPRDWRFPIRAARLLHAWRRKRWAWGLWRRAVQAKRARLRVDPQAFPDLPEMNAWELAVFFRAIYFDPDAVHVHGLNQLLSGVYAKRFLTVPLVYDAREAASQNAALPPEEARALQDKEARLLKYCDAKITVNPFCSRLMEYAYDSEPFHIVTHAPRRPTAAAMGSRDALRRRLGLGADARLLLYGGEGLDAGSGGQDLLKAMAAVRSDIHLVVTAAKDPEPFRRLAAEAGVAERVHWFPALPEEEALALAPGADAGIVPIQPVDLNHRLSSPRVLFDFIAAGLPVIGNDLPYLRRVLRGEGFGMVGPMSRPKEMAETIDRAFDRRGGHLARARRALETKGAEWGWDREAAKLKAIYARLPQPARYGTLAAPPRASVSLDRLFS